MKNWANIFKEVVGILITLVLLCYFVIPFYAGKRLSVDVKLTDMYRNIAIINPYIASIGIESGIQKDKSKLISVGCAVNVIEICIKLSEARKTNIARSMRNNALENKFDSRASLILAIALLLEGNDFETGAHDLPDNQKEFLRRTYFKFGLK